MAIIFNERFEAAGYDKTRWSESVGAGCICDEDQATGAGDPSNWGEKCLKLYKAAGNAVYTGNSFIIKRAITYYRLDVVFTAENIENGEKLLLFDVYNDVFAPAFKLRIGQTLGALKFNLECFHDGSSNTYKSFNQITVDTYYRIEIKWDATNDAWAWKIDGVSQKNDQDATSPVTSEGILTSTHVTHCKNFYLGATEIPGTIEVYYDNYGVDNADWLGAAPEYGWGGKINGVTNPAKIMGVVVTSVAKVMGVA